MSSEGNQQSAAWCDALLEGLRQPERRDPLRDAAAAADLKSWTQHMTGAVAQASESMGWVFAAKWHKLDLLPQAGQEYLSLDGMAFDPRAAPADARWLWPVAVFELENKHSDDRTAYSLWKVLNVSAPLRVVVAYRRTWEEANALPDLLADAVIRATMPVERWHAIEGEVVLVIGSRLDGASFPWDYFRFWRLDRGVCRFAKVPGVGG